MFVLVNIAEGLTRKQQLVMVKQHWSLQLNQILGTMRS